MATTAEVERRRARDRRLLRAMARHGIVDPKTTLRIARRVNREIGHMPLSRACALLEKESGGGRNVWGHDKDRRGPIPPFGGPVTRANYAEYLKRRRRDGRQQGCGPTQLTFFAFQDEADRHGGCWRPNINMYVGFSHLAKNIKLNGVHAGMRIYNGSGDAAEAYATDLRKREARWLKILRSAGASKGPAAPAPAARRPAAKPAAGPRKPRRPAPSAGGSAARPPRRPAAAPAVPNSLELLRLLERLEAREGRVHGALDERRIKLERALRRERRRRRQIEAELGLAPAPAATKAASAPAGQPVRPLEELLIKVHEKVDEERRERLLADAELRALIAGEKPAGITGGAAGGSAGEAAGGNSGDAAGPGAGEAAGGNSGEAPAAKGSAVAVPVPNGGPPPDGPAPAEPGAGAPPAPPPAEPGLEELSRRLTELDAEADRLRAQLQEGFLELEAKVVAARRRRLRAEARLLKERGIEPPRERRPGAPAPKAGGERPARAPRRPAKGAPEPRPEVKRLQQALNRFTGKYLKGVHPLAVDGIYGKRSKARVMRCKFYLGYTGEKRRSASVTRRFRQRLRHPHSARLSPPWMLALGAKRRRAQRGGHAKASGTGSPGPAAWAGARGVAEEGLAIMARHGASVTSTKRNRKATASGNVSDHWVSAPTSYAIDMGTFRGAGLAEELGRHYGFPFRPVGTFRSHVVRRGASAFRVQVLWAVEGHFDHVHLGVRRVA